MSLTSVPAYECRHCKTPLRPPLKPESHSRWSADEGQRFPLGVNWLAAEQTYNLALYSLAARTVELLFFRQGCFDEPAFVFRFDPFRNKSGPIWHCRIPASATDDAKYYAHQICGSESETAIGQDEAG